MSIEISMEDFKAIIVFYQAKNNDKINIRLVTVRVS